jgi:two-component system sensor histidine kinase CpxA
MSPRETGGSNRLFWKLFFSFWVALILFAAAVILAASFYVDRLRAQQNSATPFQEYARHIESAQAAADGAGIEGLRQWARRVDGAELIPMLAIDENGRDVLDREVSPRAMLHLRRHIQSRDPADADARPAVRLADGRAFWLFPDFQNVTLGRFLGRPRVIAVPLLAAALAGALVCLMLARYLAAPIERLRRATQAYAGGDFSHRVGPTLGKRRDEIVDLAFALDDMAERLDALLRAQRHLLRDISHELRSPLARVQAALGLARQRAGGAAEAEFDRIEREAERLGDLIGQILSVSRLDTDGNVALNVEPVALDELLAEIVQDAAIEAGTRGCSIKLSTPASATLDGDPALLHSAVENVLRNAIRYTAPGSAVTVTLVAQNGGEKGYVLRVEDCGPGVAHDMLARIFEPFVRVGDARDSTSGGHGLGLAIAQRAVRAHGGRIQAENRREGGLAVVIHLPAGSATVHKATDRRAAAVL